MSDRKREEQLLGLDREISRRDFIGSTLIGSGAALLATAAPGVLRSAKAQTVSVPLTGLGADWTGPGGIGDYARSNGNTHEVVNASHAVRNDDFAARLRSAPDTGETYDLVIVGAGFAGVSAAYRWHKERPDERVLILDVHPIFGGEAKQNEFEVDGVRLWGPQGSNGNVYPIKKAIETGFGAPLWRELGLPEEFVWQEPKGLEKELRIPPDVYGPMHITWESADQGFFYEGKGFVINPWSNRFKDAPIPDQLKQDLIWMETFRQPPRRSDWDKWLDSITYQQFITDVMGIKSDVASYLNPQMAAMGCGLGTDVASAYSAYRFLQPGVNAYDRYLGVGDVSDQVWLASWPGGNTGQLRFIVKNIIPGAFAGDMSLTNVLFNPVQWENLDRANEPVRMRLSALVVDVRHDGAPESARQVRVTYLKDGQLRRVNAERVIVAGQQHLNKRIVADLPTDVQAAMDAFMHAPICTVNVALRNWKFMEKLGITAARWFNDFGWFFSLRRQMIIDGKEPMPLDPAKPTVVTMYNSFCLPGLPVAQQTVAARMALFNMGFKDIEAAVRSQFAKMFSSAGFDPARDIAGITANRWGHAYVVSPPHFAFGKDGKPAPRDVVRAGFGRIRFAHSELEGAQMWETAVAEAERAVKQMMEVA
jgi:spermidine dehydrogenase